MSGRLLAFKMRPIWRIGALSRTESADDYAGVLIPLSEAHLHSHSARIGRCEFEALPRNDADDDDDDADADGVNDDDGPGKDGERESQGMLEEMDPAEYTIEGLRKEVRRGAKDRWTDYECEFSPSQGAAWAVSD